MLGRFQAVTILLFAALACPRPVRAESYIELLTLSPGESLWERFGHTALRVRKGTQDVVVSFGAAPFRQPSFVWAFVRGRGDFWVVSHPFPEILARYKGYNRTLQSQNLLLSPARKEELIRRLNEYLLPENNHYRYNQLYDNCATRIRDLLDEVSGGALKRAAKGRHPVESFRTLSLLAGSGSWIGSIGFDLISGPHLDPPVTGWEEMFLPLALRDRVADARLSTGPLAEPPRVILKRMGPSPLTGDLYGARLKLLGLSLAGLIAALFATRRRFASLVAVRRTAFGLITAALLCMSAMGALIVPMMLLSRVQVLDDNENGWLFWPFDLLWLGFMWSWLRGRPKLSRLAMGYGLVRLGCILMVVCMKLLGFWVQQNWVFVGMAAATVTAVFVLGLHVRARDALHSGS